jgi:hypothetical protein
MHMRIDQSGQQHRVRESNQFAPLWQGHRARLNVNDATALN